MYPDKDFDQIVQDSIISDTKTAVAMNSFLNFVAKTFESYIEIYPVFEYKDIIKQQKQLREDSTLREKIREDILISSNQKWKYILKRTKDLTKKIDEKMEKEVASIENDLICFFKKAVTKSVDKDLWEALSEKMMKNLNLD